ncbi:vacuolar protein sorting-associated 9A-like protein [Actinidia rufa]|uniref:Vacuolar protein sorting-associated 9A-like protein n=1 Tax=Actinidia rufa TaxID=165716 RepID=A0A7J0GFZ3_9ERIC|nr:vacuolar protein sorting-associated 9A-like protein [Actinidia rufa]
MSRMNKLTHEHSKSTPINSERDQSNQRRTVQNSIEDKSYAIEILWCRQNQERPGLPLAKARKCPQMSIRALTGLDRPRSRQMVSGVSSTAYKPRSTLVKVRRASTSLDRTSGLDLPEASWVHQRSFLVAGGCIRIRVFD